MFSLQNEIGNLRASVDKRVDVVQGEISQLWGSVEKWSASMQDEVRPESDADRVSVADVDALV
jgi:hypothetical protein